MLSLFHNWSDCDSSSLCCHLCRAPAITPCCSVPTCGWTLSLTCLVLTAHSEQEAAERNALELLATEAQSKSHTEGGQKKGKKKKKVSTKHIDGHGWSNDLKINQ